MPKSKKYPLNLWKQVDQINIDSLSAKYKNLILVGDSNAEEFETVATPHQGLPVYRTWYVISVPWLQDLVVQDQAK